MYGLIILRGKNYSLNEESGSLILTYLRVKIYSYAFLMLFLNIQGLWLQKGRTACSLGMFLPVPRTVPSTGMAAVPASVWRPLEKRCYAAQDWEQNKKLRREGSLMELE